MSRQGKIALALVAGMGAAFTAAAAAPAMPYTPFGPTDEYAIDFPADARTIVTGDFNNDRDVDVAVAISNLQHPKRDLLVARNRSGGKLGDPDYLWLGSSEGKFSNPHGAASGDLNADGIEDIVVSMGDPEELAIVLGRSGELRRSQLVPMPGDVLLGTPRLADVDLDDDLDVLLISDVGRLVVFTNDGDGEFADPEYASASSPRANPTVGDLDGDGDPDVATFDSTRVAPGWEFDSFHHEVLTQMNDGNGWFTPGPEYRLPFEWPKTGIVGDLNGDAVPDLVAAGDYDDAAVLLGGSGQLEVLGPRMDVNSGGASELELVDVNLDSDPDLAAGGQYASSISLGHGDGSFGPPKNYLTGALPESIEFADLNRDSAPDLAAVSRDDGYSVRLNDVLAPKIRVGAAPAATSRLGARTRPGTTLCLPRGGRLDIRALDRSPVRRVIASVGVRRVLSEPGGKHRMRVRHGYGRTLEITARDRARNSRTRAWSLKRC
jgi:hypothetical protein